MSSKAAPNNIQKTAEHELRQELDYQIRHIKEIYSNIQGGIRHIVDRRPIPVPLWKLGEDGVLTIDRIEAIIDELDRRKM